MSADDIDIAALFETEKERLFALALRITGRHDEAEDALQDAWLAALRARSSFRGEARPETWLYRIVLRSAIAARSRRRRSAAPLEVEPASPAGDDPIDAREAAERLLRALDRLGTAQRTVLALAAIERLATRQIAEILAIPEGTVWSRLHEARRRLHEELDRAGGPF